MTDRLYVQCSPDPLQTTLSKLLTYCVLRPTQPPTLSENIGLITERLWIQCSPADNLDQVANLLHA